MLKPLCGEQHKKNPASTRYQTNIQNIYFNFEIVVNCVTILYQMKYFFLFISLIFLTACSKNATDENCKFLVNAAVNVSINMNLPEYSQLQFTSNSVYIANAGNQGVIVTNVGSSFRAWDAADPNHEQRPCSRLAINGVNAVCGCDDANKYSLFTGGPVGVQLSCGLKEYRVSVSGNSLLITN